MRKQEQALLEAVDALGDDILDLAARLVSYPSVLGQEAECVRAMEDALVGLGMDPIRVPIAPERLSRHPGFAPVPWEYEAGDGRHNLVAVRKGAGGGTGRSALFNGHLDVVSPEPAEHWETDPFQPRVADGWLYGRGSGDMKSGVAAMVYAARAVERAGFGLDADLTLEAVIEEECCGNGALACLDAGYDAEAVLIPEPFGPTLLTSQVGVLWFKVELSGRPSHVLDTAAGTNAIEKCFPVIQALRDLEQELNDGPRPAAYKDMAHPLNLNIGILRGGEWPSTVPAFAELHGRLSFFPDQTWEETCARVRQAVADAALQDPWLERNQPRVSFYGFRSQGHALKADLPALRALAGCHRDLAGQDPAQYTATCTTDLRAFTAYGTGQATCFGPVAENIHAANERVRVDSVLHTARAYALFLARWCGLVE